MVADCMSRRRASRTDATRNGLCDAAAMLWWKSSSPRRNSSGCAVACPSRLADAAARDVPVALLAAGTSAASRSLVAAHSGALAAGAGASQALAPAHGVPRAADLAELADTLELFCAGRRARSANRGRPGLATVHDSGFERAH